MTTARIFAGTVVDPARAMAGAADRRSWLAPVVAATVAAVALALVLAPRIDHASAVEAQLERDPQKAQQLSPHEREAAVAQAARIGAVAAGASALFGPVLCALAVAAALWVAFRVAGAAPGFRPTLAVAAWGLLPGALRGVLSIPALARLEAIPPERADGLLPSSLAALLPAGAPERAAALAGAVDLFALWGVALVALGMAHAAGVSRRRAATVVVLLWVSWVLIERVAVPGLTGGRTP